MKCKRIKLIALKKVLDDTTRLVDVFADATSQTIILLFEKIGFRLKFAFVVNPNLIFIIENGLLSKRDLKRFHRSRNFVNKFIFSLTVLI